jgi:hypothetical protein
MRARTILASVILMLACGLMLPAWASAEVVGHITQVEGRVDLLKGGKLPATPVALQDKLESGDVLRTKSLSKAQITFVDNSIITLSPDSRLAIEEYQFDPGHQKRNAVLNLFQGMAHVVVNKLFKAAEPDFVIKTHTAVTGVRGTEFGIRLQPNGSTILNFEGALQVGNIFPEVGQLSRKAIKVAYSSSRQWGESAHGWVQVPPWYGVFVGSGLPPTVPFHITLEDQKQFMNQMSSGLMSRKSGQGSGSGSGSGSSGSGSGTGTAAAGGGTEFMTNPGGPDSGLSVASSDTTSPSVPLIAPAGLTTGTGNTTVTTLNTVTVPPVVDPQVTPPVTPPVEPPVTPPTAATYTFTQTGYSAWITSNPTSTSHVTSSTGWTERTGSWPEGTFPTYYTSTSTGDRTVAQGASFPAGTSTGTSTGTLTGTVTGVLGSSLTGTATMTGISSFGETTKFTGNVVIEPSGQMTFTYANGTISSATRLVTASGTNTYTPGTYFTQTLDGAMQSTSTSPYYTTSTSTLWAGGSSSGVLTGNFAANLTGTETAAWNYYYRQYRLDNLTGTISGVVSPGAGGTQVGALTIFPSNQDMPSMSSLVLPPTSYLFDRWGVNTPIVGKATVTNNQLTSTIYSIEYQDGRFASGVYNLTQTSQATPVTPTPATYNFTQSYYGMMGANIGMPGSPSGTIFTYGNGWGQRFAPEGASNTPGTEALNGYYNYNNQGTWTLGSGSPSLPASPFGYGSTVAVTQMSGSASGTLGHTLTGNMTFIGSLLNGTSFSYSGPGSIENGGGTVFNYTGTWANFPNGSSSASYGNASGTIYQWPGYYFKQTMGTSTDPGTYTINSNTGSLSLSGTGGSRTGVFGGTLSDFSGLFTLSSQGGPLPSGSGTASSPLVIEGVVSQSNLGGVSGNATLSVNTGVLNLTIPGQISLSSSGVSGVAGGSYFMASPGFVQNNTLYPIQVNTSNFGSAPISSLAQATLWNFTESYNGFRVSTSITSTLASTEGYGWGKSTSANLPTNYTGYFVAQDLGTRASATTLGTNWAGVTGTLTGTLSGVSGQTLTGQMTFNGTNTVGTNFHYSGQATLAADGRLLYNYYGNWVNGNQTGTGSGTLVQVPGTYLTETVTGGYQQTGTTGTPNTLAIVNTTPLTGTRTDLGSPTATTASMGVGRSSPVNTYPNSSGSTTVTVEGVVAGPTWDTRWGVASSTTSYTPTGGTLTTAPTVNGVVTLDTAGTLIGQFVGQIRNTDSSLDTIGRNLVSVTQASGLTTSSFAQTATGMFNQTPVSGTNGTQATITTPTALTGVSSGTIAGPINTNVSITSTAMQANAYNNAISSQITAYMVGAVGGPAGGVQKGVATIQATTPGTASTINLAGTTTFQPATATVPISLTTIVSGLNPLGGVSATQTGTVTITKK